MPHQGQPLYYAPDCLHSELLFITPYLLSPCLKCVPDDEPLRRYLDGGGVLWRVMVVCVLMIGCTLDFHPPFFSISRNSIRYTKSALGTNPIIPPTTPRTIMIGAPHTTVPRRGARTTYAGAGRWAVALLVAAASMATLCRAGSLPTSVVSGHTDCATWPGVAARWRWRR